MGFTNVSLLLGLTLAAIPIALHLLGRRKPKRVEFPATRFLTQRIDSNRRRMRVQHWMLLALRVLAIALLAIALAQPFAASVVAGRWLSIGTIAVLGLVTAGLALWAYGHQKPTSLALSLAVVSGLCLLGSTLWAAQSASTVAAPSINTQQPTAVAIVIDNSVRLTYQEGDQSRLQIARQWAQWILKHYRANSTVAIVERSGRPVVAAFDVSAAQRAIQRIHPLAAPRPLGQRIEAAAHWVASSQIPQKTLFVITDRTAASWPAESSVAVPPEITLRVIDIGQNQAPRNRQLAPLQTAAESIAQGIPISVQTQVQSKGEFSDDEVSVQLSLLENDPRLPVQRDGKNIYPEAKVIDRQVVSLGPSGIGDVELTLPGLPPGVHHANVTLVDRDPLAVDNIRYLCVAVDQAPRVLLAGDQEAERTVIEKALKLPGISGTGSVDYQVTSIPMAQLESQDLATMNAVCLLDPPKLTSQQLAALTSWVTQGGSLLLSLGPTWDQRDLDNALASQDPGATSDLSPGAPNDPGALRSGLFAQPLRQWRVPQPGSFLQLRDTSHRALAAFALEGSDVPWQRYRIERYWQLDKTDQDIALAEFAGTSHPALLERRVGNGRVMVLTTPLPGVAGAARRWNELMSTSEDFWPAFLLVRGLFEYLTDRDQGTLNVRVSQPVALKTPQSESSRYQLFHADTPPVVVEAGINQINPGPPMQPGHYWLRGTGTTLGYAANLSSNQTDMSTLPIETLNDILGQRSFELINDREQIDWTSTSGTPTEPFYAQCMLLVCGLFVLEQLLANRFYQ